MDYPNLQKKLSAFKNPVDMLYNAQGGAMIFPGKAEFTNWYSEQIAWRETSVLQDMSWHMTEITLKGKDVVQLVSDLGINSLKNFGPMTAKQFVACNHEGYVIGDAILICEEENEINFLGRPACINWVEYHAQSGKYEVEIVNKELPTADASKRRNFRFQVQGPTAQLVLEDLNGGPLPDIPFFKMGKFNIGKHTVTALNHRMSGAPGYEFWGPMEHADEVRNLIVAAGKKHGMQQLGGKSYPVTATVSGWYGGILPAVYTGKGMDAYQQWLPANSSEGRCSLGGSYTTDQIEELYQTPYDVGYGFMVKFDHEFIGRDALEAIAKAPRRRKKVRLVWNSEDVTRIMGGMFAGGEHYKTLNLPTGNYSTYTADEILADGKRVGLSNYPAFSANDRQIISLAIIDADQAVDGKELTLTWGEPDGGSTKPTVEDHVQTSVRVTVDTKPVKRD